MTDADRWAMIQLADRIFDRAKVSAVKAIDRFPQPNYVIGKIGEEAGEVIGAYIHMAENRGSREHLEAEAVQLIGLVIRLLHDGDRTITKNAPDLGPARDK